MRKIVVAALGGLAICLAGAGHAEAGLFVKKKKVEPVPVDETCPNAWYFYKGKCIPYGRSWYGAPSYIYRYGPNIRYFRHRGGRR